MKAAVMTMLNRNKQIAHVTALLRILHRDIQRSDIFKYASAMAYVTLFSLIPSIAAVFSLVSIFRPFWGEGSDLMNTAKEFILSNLARGSGEQVLQYLENFIGNLDVAKIGISGFAGITVTLTLLLRNIERAMNQIFHVETERNLFSRFVNFWTFVTLGTFIAGIAVGVFSGFDLSNLNPFRSGELNSGFGAWIVPKIATFVCFVLLYKVAPNTNVPLREACIGALVATIMFSAASKFYGDFSRKFTNYEAVYGALAAIPLFLMWLYLIWVIILMGGVVASRCIQGFSYEHTVEELKFKAKSRMEKFRNHQLEPVVAFVVLGLIYSRFQEGSGKGIKVNELRDATGLPDDWLLDALGVLAELNLVLVRGAASIESDIENSILFPTQPAEHLDVAKAREFLWAAANQWLSEWQPKCHINADRLAALLQGSMTLAAGSGQLQELVQRRA